MFPSTIDRITTQGKLRAATIASARDVFPDPELPATPMMLVLDQGGEYWAFCIFQAVKAAVVLRFYFYKPQGSDL